jgi:hypothetical protein
MTPSLHGGGMGLVWCSTSLSFLGQSSKGSWQVDGFRFNPRQRFILVVGEHDINQDTVGKHSLLSRGFRNVAHLAASRLEGMGFKEVYGPELQGFAKRAALCNEGRVCLSGASFLNTQSVIARML